MYIGGVLIILVYVGGVLILSVNTGGVLIVLVYIGGELATNFANANVLLNVAGISLKYAPFNSLNFFNPISLYLVVSWRRLRCARLGCI